MMMWYDMMQDDCTYIYVPAYLIIGELVDDADPFPQWIDTIVAVELVSMILRNDARGPTLVR